MWLFLAWYLLFALIEYVPLIIVWKSVRTTKISVTEKVVWKILRVEIALVIVAESVKSVENPAGTTAEKELLNCWTITSVNWTI